MTFSQQNISDLAKLAINYNASDIHIRVDEPPSIRIKGELIQVKSKVLTAENIIDICNIITKNNFNPTEGNSEIDGSVDIDNICRLRFNIFKTLGQIGITFRIIKSNVPSIDELKFKPIIKTLSEKTRGLILVTGATGHGKSTTLSAMINHINSNRKCHIITIEDPIEYIHKSNLSRITQREIGLDTKDFTSGIISALRQDPDVIQIGEMRDRATFETALNAAETGHLVLSTIHTTNAPTTISRILSMFPPEQLDDIKKRLAENLIATIGQRMLKSIMKNQMILAQEVMVVSPGIRECILGTQPLSNVQAILEKGNLKGGGNGSQSFDQAIQELYSNKFISKEVALKQFSSEKDFIRQQLIE